MKLNRDILHRVMVIAQEMTEIGAEISRVEESVDRICCAYGAVRTDVFATISNVIVSVEDENGAVITQTRRIKKQISNNMEKLHQYNDLVRWMTVNTPERQEIDERLEKVRAAKKYPSWMSVLFSALVSSAFCLFFGSRSYQEIITAFVVGIASGLLMELLSRIRFNPILVRFLCALAASLIAMAAMLLNFIQTPEYVLIGNIMTLIPGVGLTNAMRDLFSGDAISGVLRSIEALLFALAIAVGIMLPSLLSGGVLS